MDESAIWGGVGVLLAIGGLGIILPELLTELSHSGFAEPMVLYGAAVAAAVVLAVLIVVPSVISDR